VRSSIKLTKGDVSASIGQPAALPMHGRTIWRSHMKMLIAISTFTILIAAAVVTQPASAAPPNDLRNSDQSGQGSAYKGYPLRDWYRPDSW